MYGCGGRLGIHWRTAAARTTRRSCRFSKRAVANETDSQVRRWVERFAAPALSERDRQDSLRAAYTPFQEYGRCDFCGETGRRVRTEYDTELTCSGGSGRLAQICQQCDGQAS